MSEPIILFDLPSKAPHGCWSFNPWKTRLLLSYKGLDFRTEWVEYPNIKARLSPHLPPNEDDTPYTIPTIHLPSTNTYVMDSWKIAQHIEALHPSPPLHLASPILAKLDALMLGLKRALQCIYIPRIPQVLLNDASVAYWYETRERDVGMTLAQLEDKYPADGCWERAGPVLREVTALLEEGGEGGPFFMGGEVSYADFVWGGFLLFLGRLGMLEEALARSGGEEVHRGLLRALEPWVRND